MFGRRLPIPLLEVFPLEGHPVLDGDAAAEGFDPLEVARRDGLGVVEEPSQSLEGNIAVHRLEDVEEAGDRLVIGGVEAEGPAVLRQEADNLGEFLLHDRRKVGSRLQEVLEIGGGENEHLAGAVHAVEVVPLPRRGHRDPSGEVRQFPLGVLGEEVVGDPQGEFPFSCQILDHLIIVRVVLEAAAGVYGAGEPQPVQLAHELAGRIDLVRIGELRPLGQARVKDHGVRLGDEEPRRVPRMVALNLTAGRIGRLPGIAQGAQRRPVDDGAVVKVQNEDRRVGRDLVDLLQGRHATLGKLELRPAADDPHPLGRRGAPGLLTQHREGIGERGNAIPAKFHVVVEPAPDHVDVGIVETRDDASPLKVDPLRLLRPPS